MAILRSKAIALEIAFPYVRVDAVIYDFRITWHGHDLISRAARFRDEDSGLPETTPFNGWDYKTDRLCDTFDRALATNRAQYWVPVDPFLGVGIVPGGGGIQRYISWSKADGHNRLQAEFAQLDATPSDSDGFTVHLELDPNHQLRYEDNGGGIGNFGISIYTDRATLTQFARELRAEHLDCQANRKEPPSEDDTLWRLIS